MADHALTPLILQNETLLRAIAAGTDHTSQAKLAAGVGRDESNVRKSIRALAAEGLVGESGTRDWLRLTDHGRAAIESLDRAAGAFILPDRLTNVGPDRAPHTAFVRNPDNPRKAFDDDETLDLARAIAGAQDVLQSIIAYPPNPEGGDASGARMLADGERRWLAVTLLAEGKVEGCALPPLLDPAQGGGIPFTTRERTEAENAAQAAYLALIANTGKLLDPLEDGQALLTVMTARQWSAREAAFQLGRVGKTTGEAGAGTTGVKTVQERVKVAREATEVNKARYRTEPEFTWKDLLASVQATKQAAEDVAATPAGAYHPLPVEDLIELPDPRPNWRGGPLAAIELARRPDGRWTYGYKCNDNLGGQSSGPGWIEGSDHDAFDTRAAAFHDAIRRIRDWADGREHPAARKILRWLDGLSPDASPNDPCVYNGERFPNATMAGEARRRREGGGGASSPGRPKAAHPPEDEGADQGIAPIIAGSAAAEETDDRIEIPGFLRRLAGSPVDAEPEPAAAADQELAAGTQARIAVDRAFADANSGVAGFATLLAMAGLSAPFRIKSDDPGLIYDAKAGWVGSMDTEGDLPADLAHAQAKLVAGALNAAAGFGPPVRVNDDLPEDLAASPLGALHNAAQAVRDWMLESYDALNGAAGSSEIYRRLSDALARSAHHARQPAPAEPGTPTADEAA